MITAGETAANSNLKHAPGTFSTPFSTLPEKFYTTQEAGPTATGSPE